VTLTTHTLGTAAHKILTGEIDANRLPGIIARCAWCQKPRSNHECWHEAAQVLFDRGLRGTQVGRAQYELDL
jgi:hypothetical protein